MDTEELQISSLKSIQTMQWVQTGVTALALFLGGTLYIKAQSAAADDWAPGSKEEWDHGYKGLVNDPIIMKQYNEYLKTT